MEHSLPGTKVRCFRRDMSKTDVVFAHTKVVVWLVMEGSIVAIISFMCRMKTESDNIILD